MTLKILQWNVWYKEKADNILSLLKDVDADILCLQELTQDSVTNPSRDIAAEIVELGYNKKYQLTINRSRDKMGNGIFSKYPISNSRVTYVQREELGSLDYSKENRVYIEVAVKINKRILTLGTTHLSYSHAFTSSPEKEIEAMKLYNEVDQHTEAFILTGDFNAVPDSQIIEHFNTRFTHAGPNFKTPTWTTKPFTYNGFEADSLRWRLDYVFTTRDIVVISSEILPTDTSDHLPILTTIEI